MGNHTLESYKACVASQLSTGARRLTAFALVFLGVSACADADGLGPGAGDAGGAGQGGSAPGASGDGTVPVVGGAGGAGGAREDTTAAGGAEPPPSPPEGTCSTDADCDDGKFCNGAEKCRPRETGAQVKVCMAPEQGPCGANACDEASAQCDCTQADHDGDGFRVLGCTAPGEPVDCDDNDDMRHPGLQEVCNLDNPTHDEDCVDTTIAGVEADEDGDGFFNSVCANYQAFQPIGISADQRLKNLGRDCNDGDEDVHPGAPETCDDQDNDCNGIPDDVAGTPPKDRKRYYEDLDGDRWGNEEKPLFTSCNIPPVGYTYEAGDCDDQDAAISPSRAEICNGKDDDCDLLTDQPLTPGTLMLDEPYDGGLTEFACQGAGGWTITKCPASRLDCDDSYLDGCETIGTSLCNCHQCGKVCQFSCGEEKCEEIRAVSTGLFHACMLVQADENNGAGTVACTGRNGTGQLGQGTKLDSDVAKQIEGLRNATSVTSGNFHSCAVESDGRGYCWGRNNFGQLGLGSPGNDVPAPAQILPLNGLKMKLVAAGSLHTCAIYEGGEVECWGRGDDGQLGNGYEEDSGYPGAVVRLVDDDYYEPLNGVTQVAAGFSHTCALTNGSVECWGSNDTMQLGRDPLLLPSAPTATPVPGLEEFTIDEIAAAAVTTCARAGTQVYCWGGNAYYQLGHSDAPMGPPRRVDLPDDVVKIAVGPFFACALSQDGRVRCWGANPYGVRGTLDDPPAVLPTLVPVEGATKLFVGNGTQVCVSKGDDSAWCWGRNDFGQLGNGSTSMQAQPYATRVSAWGSAALCP